MKKILVLVSLLAILTPISNEINAQSSKKTLNSKKKKKKDDEENPFRIEKFWFGGGLGLGTGPYDLSNSIRGNLFNFSLSPIAGYKFTNWLSAGPRLEFTYLGGRFSDVGTVYKLNGFAYGAGIFARAKFLSVLFVHVEYSANSTLSLTGNISSSNRLETERLWNDHFFAGLGYNPQGKWGYEFYVLYDFLVPSNSAQLPFNYRGGITWNF